MAYKREYKDEFVVPVFTQESGYWEKMMKPRLQDQGWYIAEVDCAGVDTSHELGCRLLRALGFNIAPDQRVNGFWVKDAVEEADWNDMRQGFLYSMRTLKISLASGKSVRLFMPRSMRFN